MGEMARADPTYTATLRRIKQALDPRGVIDPGLYL